jgi:hypothetical protein
MPVATARRSEEFRAIGLLRDGLGDYARKP